MKQPPPKNTRLLKKLIVVIAYAVGILTCLTLGFFVQSAVVGKLLLIAYAVFVVVRKVESRTTFALALVAFWAVVAASVQSKTGLAHTFALYAFMLLIIATISLAFEVRDEL